MKNILFGITSLDIGGAEKTLIDISNSLCNEYNISIFSLYGNSDLRSSLISKNTIF